MAVHGAARTDTQRTTAMELTTPRLVLRDLTEADAASLMAYQSDPRYLALCGPATLASRRALFDSFHDWQRASPRRHFQLGIVSRQDDALLGCGGLREVDPVTATAVVGLELAPAHWGRYGIAVEAARALLAFGFDTLGLREIRGVTTSGNRRVARLAAWFGAEIAARRPGAAAPAAGSGETWRIGRAAWLAPPHRTARRISVPA
jgi:ribosomal-protein-alanine N-acetyltransferase